MEEELLVAQPALGATTPKKSPQEQPWPGKEIVSMVREEHGRKFG